MKTKDHIGFVVVILITVLLAVMSGMLAWNSDPGNVNTSPAARILNDEGVLANKSREELIGLIKLGASIAIEERSLIKDMSKFLMSLSRALMILLVIQLYIWRRFYLSRPENERRPHDNAG
jgi:hypothetical protein